jgi:3-hydroxybutyryl-CoA dehydrogenase
MAKRKGIMYLVGELPLILEFGEVCHAAGYTITAKINTDEGRGARLPKFFSRSTTLPRNISLACELTNTDHARKQKNLRFLDSHFDTTTTIVSSSITVAAMEQASWLRHPERLVGIGAFPTLMSGKLIEIAPTIHCSRKSLSDASTIITSLGRECAVVQDRAGMVMPRILCMLINEAAFALMENIATPSDIDTAMKLGTNYPFGPIEWADRIGIRSVVSVLEAIHSETGEDRHRIAPLLRQMAVGTKWWGT